VTEPVRLSLRQWMLVLAVALVALVPGQFQIPAMDRDEARYAQASRQMIETGDVIDIRFQDVPRHVKPIGTYWLQAASAVLAGGADVGIWAYRLPSLLAAVAAVLMTAWLGARIGGASVGLVAGVLLATALITGVEARTAKTDALLLVTVLAAQIALHRLATRDDITRARFWGAPAAFWIAHGLGVLIKGPIITLVLATTVAAVSVWRRDREVLRDLWIGRGLLLTAAIVAPWLIAITAKVGPAFLEEAVGHALLGKVARGDDAHGAPPGYHTLVFLVAFWPGSILAAGAVATAWSRRVEPSIRLLICWIVPTWIVFELVATKLPHYTYPVYPAIAILTGLFLSRGLDAAATGGWRWAQRATSGLALVVAVALAAVPVGATLYLEGIVTPWSGTASLLGVGVLGLTLRFVREMTVDRLLALAVAASVFYAATFAGVAPRLDHLWIARAVESRIAGIADCADPAVAFAGFHEPSTVFTLGTATRLTDPAGAVSFLAVSFLTETGGCRIAAIEDRMADAFTAAVSTRGLTPRVIATVEGLNYSRGDDIRLTLWRN